MVKAASRKGFKEAYESLELEYKVTDQLIKVRSRAGLTQDAVAKRIGTTKSAVSRVEAAGKYVPSLSMLKRYLQAIGNKLQIKQKA